MKEIREEAEKHRKAKLEKYGADHKACGGSMKKYAHGGHVEHDDEKEDKALIKKEVKSDCLKHRDMGGPIAGGPSGRLGRGRKGKKPGTNVNVVVAGKGDGPSAPMMPPPALGSGPSAAPVAPKPIMPPPGAGPAGPVGLPPRPGIKHGGKVHGHKHEKKHEHKEHKRHEHRHHGHRGH